MEWCRYSVLCSIHFSYVSMLRSTSFRSELAGDPQTWRPMRWHPQWTPELRRQMSNSCARPTHWCLGCFEPMTTWKTWGSSPPLYDWVMLANGKRFNFSWSLMAVYGLWVNWSPCESSKVWICFVPRLTGFIEVGMLKARLVLCCGGLLVVIFPDIHWLQWLIRRQGLW